MSHTTPTDYVLSPAERNLVLFASTVAAFLTPFMGSAVNIALPDIGHDFGLGASGLTWVGTAYLLSSAILLLPLGKAADLFGRKTVFSCGLLVYILATSLCALAGNGAELIAFRAFQGLSGAMIFATSMAILVSAFPDQDRGRVLGINTASVYMGLSLGPFLGGLLTQTLGWRSVFWSTIPLGILAWVLVLWHLPADRDQLEGWRFDTAGSLLYGISLASLIYGFSRLTDWRGGVFIAIALAGFTGFILWEKKIAHPVLEVGLFRHNRVFAFSSLAALINYSATFALTFLLSLYLQYLKGLTPQQAGLILVLQPAVMALTSPIAGRLADGHPAQTVASLGMGLDVLGLAMLIFIDGRTSLGYIMAALLLIGLGFGLFSTPNTHAVMGAVTRRDYGVASATLGTMRLLGQMFSMGLSLLLLTLFLGETRIRPEVFPAFTACLRVAFSLFSALCLAGVFASLARGKREAA